MAVEKGSGARIYDRPAQKGRNTLLLLGLVLLIAIGLWIVL